MPASASPPPSPPVRTPGQQPSHPASATNRSRTPQNDRFALYSPRNPDRRWIRAKEDGACGGAARDGDRVDLLAPAPPLLAEARDDEQRVVDADREADHRRHVLREEVQVVAAGDHGRPGHREDDRADREDDREEGGDHRAEDDHQDREGNRRPEQLALLEVLLTLLDEVDREGRLAGDEDLELRALVECVDGDVDLLDHLLGVVDGAGHRDGDDRAAAVSGDEVLVTGRVEGVRARDDLRARRQDVVLQLLHGGLELGVVDREGLGADEDRLGNGLLAGQLLVDQVLRLDRAGVVGLVELGRQRVGEASAHRTAEDAEGDHEDREPDADHPPRV